MSIAPLLRNEKPRALTAEEEKLKRDLYEKIPPRRRKFIDRIGYDKWDPFPEPNEPVEIRTDITKRTAQQLMQEFVRSKIPAEDLLGFIHYNTEVIDADRQGRAPYDVSQSATDEIRKIKAILDQSE